jgi:hypothetical protein
MFSPACSYVNVGQNGILTAQDGILRYKLSSVVVRPARVISYVNNGGLPYNHYFHSSW